MTWDPDPDEGVVFLCMCLVAGMMLVHLWP